MGEKLSLVDFEKVFAHRREEKGRVIFAAPDSERKKLWRFLDSVRAECPSYKPDSDSLVRLAWVGRVAYAFLKEIQEKGQHLSSEAIHTTTDLLKAILADNMKYEKYEEIYVRKYQDPLAEEFFLSIEGKKIAKDFDTRPSDCHDDRSQPPRIR